MGRVGLTLLGAKVGIFWVLKVRIICGFYNPRRLVGVVANEFNFQRVGARVTSWH